MFYKANEKKRPKGRIKAFNSREADKILRKNGWVCVRSTGGHTIYKHPDYAENISINTEVNRILFEKYVKRFNLMNA